MDAGSSSICSRLRIIKNELEYRFFISIGGKMTFDDLQVSDLAGSAQPG